MPRSDAAKKWEPDAFGKNMIDRITQFAVVSERSAEQLRLFDLSEIGPMWAHAQADFQSDPVKYPSVMAKKNDLEGRKQFQIKCQAICFPQKPPSDPKHHILIIFAAQAAIQSLSTQDLDMHPYEGEISYRAGLQAMKALGDQDAYDAAIEFDRNLYEKPIDLLYETIRCRDRVSGRITEYTVVDCGNSLINGDYLVLEDVEGASRRVSAQELDEIRVG